MLLRRPVGAAAVRRAYLAGPEVFMPDPMAEAARLKRLCATFGFKGIFPLDAAITHSVDETLAQHAARIRAANLDLIRGADLVFANVSPFRGPSADDGTAYEMGFATALGRPVFAYSDDADTLLTRTRRLLRLSGEGHNWRDERGMLVEEFGLGANLMLVDPATGGIHPSFDAALTAAQAYFAGD